MTMQTTELTFADPQRSRRGGGGPRRDRAQRAAAARTRRLGAGDGRRQGRRLRPRRHPGRRGPRWPRAPPNSASPPSTRRWRCAATASPRRCWRGCTRRAPTSPPRCRPTSSWRCRRRASSASCSTRSSAPVAPPRHRQGGHRAEPQRRERRRVPGDADRAAPRAGRRGDPAARHHVASGARRRPRQPRQRPSGAAARPTCAAQARDQGVHFEIAHLSQLPCGHDPSRPGLRHGPARHRGVRADARSPSAATWVCARR